MVIEAVDANEAFGHKECDLDTLYVLEDFHSDDFTTLHDARRPVMGITALRQYMANKDNYVSVLLNYTPFLH